MPETVANGKIDNLYQTFCLWLDTCKIFECTN